MPTMPRAWVDRSSTTPRRPSLPTTVAPSWDPLLPSGTAGGDPSTCWPWLRRIAVGAWIADWSVRQNYDCQRAGHGACRRSQWRPTRSQPASGRNADGSSRCIDCHSSRAATAPGGPPRRGRVRSTSRPVERSRSAAPSGRPGHGGDVGGVDRDDAARSGSVGGHLVEGDADVPR